MTTPSQSPDKPASPPSVGIGSSACSALLRACQIAENIREMDAAEYSREETAIMALYFEVRRLKVIEAYRVEDKKAFDFLRDERDRLRRAAICAADNIVTFSDPHRMAQAFYSPAEVALIRGSILPNNQLSGGGAQPRRSL